MKVSEEKILSILSKVKKAKTEANRVYANIGVDREWDNRYV